MNLKSVLLSVILLALIHFATSVDKAERNLADPFNFRFNILRRFNYARTIIASGDLEQLFQTFKPLLDGDKKKSFPTLGPAMNMFKLKWNRTLETIAYEKTENDLVGKATNKYGHIATEGHVSFYWMGDIVEALLELIKSWIPIAGKFLDKYYKVIELIVIIIWMAINYPMSTPYNENDHGQLDATEVLHARRYDIGCYSRIAYSLCVLQPIPYDGFLFKRGASCLKCPPGSECEVFRNEDGGYREGSLCVVNETLMAELKEKERLASMVNVTATTDINFGLNPGYLMTLALFLIFYCRFLRN